MKPVVPFALLVLAFGADIVSASVASDTALAGAMAHANHAAHHAGHHSAHHPASATAMATATEKGPDAVVAASVPVDHVRWTPDAPLQEGMRRMRDALEGLKHHEMGHLDETQVLNLATEVDEAAAFMFAHCKLTPEPDVALHGLLAQWMAGAEALRANPIDAAAVAPMRAALEDYPRLFDDPAFFETEPQGVQ